MSVKAHSDNISLTFTDNYSFNFVSHLCRLTDNMELAHWPLSELFTWYNEEENGRDDPPPSSLIVALY